MKKLITLTLFLGALISKAQIFSENFNAGIPSSFTLTDVDGATPAANVSTFTGAFTAQTISGQDCAGSTSWHNPIGQADDWMATPLITIPNTTAPVSLSFDAIAPDANYPDGVEVYVSTTGTAPADFLSSMPLYNTTGTGESSAWTTRTIDLSNYYGQAIYIAFRNNSNDQFILGIDNIAVTELQDNNIEVVSANIDEVLAGNRSVDIVIKNIGANNVTSLNVDWVFGGVTTPVSITGINLTGGQTHTETIPLGSLNVGGPYTFSATVNSVNGTTDPDMTNNSITNNYTIVEPIPNWTMTDSYGNSITLHDELAAGKMVVLDFMASWCTPCELSTPELNTLYVNHTTNGLDNINVFGITVEANDNVSIMNNLGWGGTYPKFSYTNENDAQYFHYAATLGLNTGGSIPFFVMICPNKNDPGNSSIIKSDVGFTSGLFNSYETAFSTCPSADNTSGSSTDINESNSSLNTYPNPAKDLLNINGSFSSVDIYNLFGKLVLSSEYVNPINVSSLANGIYILKITTEKGIHSKKVTITK